MKKIPRSTIIPVILLVYLAVMASIGWKEYATGKMTPLNYWGIIVITLIVIVLLHFNLRKRERLRREREDDMKGKNGNL